MRDHRKIPRLRISEWIGQNEVRLFFSSGKIVEMKLPWVKSAKNTKVVDVGMGLALGDGRDVSSWTLCERRGRVLRKGRPGFIGSPRRVRAK